VGVANFMTAPIIARLVIGLEWMLGLFLLLNIKLKQFTLPASALLLVAFNIYLIYELIAEGNRGNCGCFGTYLQMTPLQSIIKNVGLILIIILLWKIYQRRTYRYVNWIAIISVATSLSLPFILNPVDFLNAKNLQPEATNFPLRKDLILEKNTFGAPPVDLFAGKHVIAFMSLTCPYCKQAAFKIHVIHERYPEIPFLFFLNGKDKDVDEFFAETKSENIEHFRMSAIPFLKFTQGSFPTIFWVNNGIVEKKSDYYTLTEEELLQWWKSP